MVGRVTLGFVGITLQVIALKRLPLVLVAIVTNTVPLVTAVLSYFILGETLRRIDKICMALAFTGVLVMISGSELNSKDDHTYPSTAVISLLLCPVISALVTILLRTLRGISAHTQCFYHAFFQACAFGAFIILSLDDMMIIQHLHTADYFLLTFSALCTFIF